MQKKPQRKPVRKKPVPRQQPARRRESAPPEEVARTKRAQKEKAAQRAEVEALRKKWQQERENFLANAGAKIAKQKVRPPFQVEEPRRNPVQYEAPKQHHAVEDHDMMNTYERALKEARVQVCFPSPPPLHVCSNSIMTLTVIFRPSKNALRCNKSMATAKTLLLLMDLAGRTIHLCQNNQQEI